MIIALFEDYIRVVKLPEVRELHAQISGKRLTFLLELNTLLHLTVMLSRMTIVSWNTGRIANKIVLQNKSHKHHMRMNTVYI